MRLVTPGVDTRRFTPDGPAYPLPTRKAVRFLYVGDLTLDRGVDLLLGAYLRAFSAEDDVCLVIKTAKSAALAATRHLIHAESASTSNVSVTIQAQLLTAIARAIHRLSASQPPPSRYA